jgi:hypothetical protein
MDRDARTTPLGLWRFGEAYLQAAKHLLSVADDLNFPAPIYFLASHSIELALKSFIRAHGGTLEDLRCFGHRLTPLLKHARKHGLDKGESAANDSKLIARLDVFNRDHEFRYIVTGYKPDVPELKPLLNVAGRLLTATRPACDPTQPNGNQRQGSSRR